MAGHETFMVLVEEDRMELLLRYPFFGRVICQCELVPVQSPNAPIACNDCRRIYLSERAYTALSPEARLLILAHEVLHITLRHAFRKGNRDEERFSFAADAEIYPLLRDDFPQQGMVDYDEDWNGLTAEEIYELLPKNLPEPPPMHCYPSNTPSDDGHGDKEDANHSKDESLSCDGAENVEGAEEDADNTKAQKSDDHEGEDSVQDEGNVPGEDEGQDDGDGNGDNGDGDGQGNGGGNGSGNGNGQGDGQSNGDGQGQGAGQRSKEDSSENGQNGGTSGDVDGKISGNTQDSDDGVPCKSQKNDRQPSFDADTEMFCRNLSAEAQIELKTKNGRGNAPGNLLRLLEKINAAHIDWKSLLRQFIREVRGGSYRWLPPNRRFISRGLYLPGRRQKMFRGVVALDTSGSTVDDLPDFVGEVECLMRSFGKFELTVIECDAAIGNVTVVSSNTRPHDWRNHRFSGGGGTNFSPVFEYIEGKRIRPDVLLFFTDGDGFCPQANPGYPVLWLLTGNGEAPVPWGFHIKMKG